MRQSVPVHASSSYFWKIHFNIRLPSTPRSSKLSLSSGLFTKNLYASVLLRIRVTWPAHLLMLDLITRIIFGEGHRPQSSSLCRFPHYSVPSSFLGPNIFLSTLFSNTLIVTDQVPHPQKRENYSSVYLRLYIFRKQTARQKILHRTIARFPWLRSALNLFIHGILFH
jgi:hypothetical protein